MLNPQRKNAIGYLIAANGVAAVTKEWLALFAFLVIGMLCGQLAGRAREAGQVEALREMDRLKSVLLSSVSHDLRTPLIKAAVTSLLQNNALLDAASQRGLLLSINEASDKLNALIGNLLDLSRIEAGAWQPGKELNDLSGVIGTCWSGSTSQAISTFASICRLTCRSSPWTTFTLPKCSGIYWTTL